MKTNLKRASDGKLEQPSADRGGSQSGQTGEQSQADKQRDDSADEFEFADEYQLEGEDSADASTGDPDRKPPPLHMHHLDIPPLIRQLLLSLQLMTRVLMQNAHKLHVFWPRVKPLLCEILSMSKPSLSETTTPGNLSPSQSSGNLNGLAAGTGAATNPAAQQVQQGQQQPQSKLTSDRLETALHRRAMRRPVAPMVVEAAVVALLRIAIQSFNNLKAQVNSRGPDKQASDAARKDIMQTLQLLSNVDLRNDLLAMQYSQGLHRLAQGQQAMDWTDLHFCDSCWQSASG